MRHFIILSYPRSGNTWLRYIIERGFNIRTYGYLSKIDIAPLLYTEEGYRDYDEHWIGFKRHSETHHVPKDTPLIYVERNMDEAITRQLENHPEFDRENEREKWYRNRFIFESWGDNRFKVEFNQFITDPSDVIPALQVFFGRECNPDLLERLQFHKEKSLEIYRKYELNSEIQPE